MKRLSIIINDKLYKGLREIQGKRIQKELRSIPMNKIVNEYLVKGLENENSRLQNKP